MQFSSLPTKFQIPFANSAANTNVIPQASQIGITLGAASLTDGFPPTCFLPVGAGGVPPWGRDFNGLLNQITQWTQWQNAGGMTIYDSTFSTAISGYPNHAILASGTQSGAYWVNIADNNTNNPDTTTSPGNNWLGLGTTFRIPSFVLNGVTSLNAIQGTALTIVNWTSGTSVSFSNNSTLNGSAGTFTVGSKDAGTWYLLVTLPYFLDTSLAVLNSQNAYSFALLVNGSSVVGALANYNALIPELTMIHLNPGDVVSVQFILNVNNSNRPFTSPVGSSTFLGIRMGP